MTRAWGVIAVLAVLTGASRAGAEALDTDSLALALAAVPALADVGVPTARDPEPEPTRFVPPARGGRRFAPAVERWRDLVAGYDWDQDQALGVIACESRGDPRAVNPSSGAAGLLQLLGWGALARRLFGSGDVLDPAVNLGTGYHLWRSSGGSFRPHWQASAPCWGGT